MRKGYIESSDNQFLEYCVHVEVADLRWLCEVFSVFRVYDY